MLWAPNQGSGYPYARGPFAAAPGTPAYAALDTNRDGLVDMRDDPYGLYYPGDDAVDWVGMSLYHWGFEYPWGDNIVPEPGKFIGQLTSTYATPHQDERTLPDFYHLYADGHDKPMAIPETAAFYRPGWIGADERAIKLAWLTQVFGGDVLQHMPRIRLISWFEWKKFEVEVHDTVDWRISADPYLAASFRETLDRGGWLSADDI